MAANISPLVICMGYICGSEAATSRLSFTYLHPAKCAHTR
jgi:hypothetical protein